MESAAFFHIVSYLSSHGDRKGGLNMAYREAQAQQYQSPNAIYSDEDDLNIEAENAAEFGSFSSVVRDHDKPSKKMLNAWRRMPETASAVQREIPFISTNDNEILDARYQSMSENELASPMRPEIVKTAFGRDLGKREAGLRFSRTQLGRKPMLSVPPNRQIQTHQEIQEMLRPDLEERAPPPAENFDPQTGVFGFCINHMLWEDSEVTNLRQPLAPLLDLAFCGSVPLHLCELILEETNLANSHQLLADLRCNNPENLITNSKNTVNQNQLEVALEVVRLKRRVSSHRNSFVESPKQMKAKRNRKTRVRFANRLVTKVVERPFTQPEEMCSLYFIDGELEELERDRSNVDNDQFECIMLKDEQDLKTVHVEVEHNSRKLHDIREDELPHSFSDLSFF